MKFSKTLKKLRTDNNLTQEQLAKSVDIATSTIAMYENGSRLPSLSSAIKISNFFNVPIAELLDAPEHYVASTFDNKKNSINAMLYNLTIDDLEQIIQFIKFLKSTKSNH